MTMAGGPPVYATTMPRLLRSGLIGTITHLGCVDRRVARADDGSAEAAGEYLQLLAYGADHLASIRDLLGVDPVRAMGRCVGVPWQSGRPGSITETFLAMASGVHVHYHGSLVANRDHHELWIDGERGVLRSDGRLVWFRKTGWPLFVPIASALRPRTGDRASPEARAAARRRRLAASDGGIAAGDGEERWPLTMAEAVMRADRAGRPVAITQLVGPAASAGSDA